MPVGGFSSGAGDATAAGAARARAPSATAPAARALRFMSSPFRWVRRVVGRRLSGGCRGFVGRRPVAIGGAEVAQTLVSSHTRRGGWAAWRVARSARAPPAGRRSRHWPANGHATIVGQGLVAARPCVYTSHLKLRVPHLTGHLE